MPHSPKSNDSQLKNGFFGSPMPCPEQAQPLSARRQLGVVALSITFILLGNMLSQLLIDQFVALLAPSIRQADWYLIVLASISMYLCAMPLSLFFFTTAEAGPPQPRRIKPLALLGLLTICIALTYLCNFIGFSFNALLEAITKVPPKNDLVELTSSTPLWANLLFMGILAPIMEEIFLRKLTIDRLTFLGELPAALLSGLAFGLMHSNSYQVFYTSALGIVFGMIYLATGKLRYTIALHISINLIGGVFISELLKHIDIEAFSAAPLEYAAQSPIPIALLLLFFAFLAICFLAAPIALILLWKRFKPQKNQSPLSRSAWRRALLCNPAVWIFFGAILMLFFI